MLRQDFHPTRSEGLTRVPNKLRESACVQTFTEMAREQAAGAENWRDLDKAAADGLDNVKW